MRARLVRTGIATAVLLVTAGCGMASAGDEDGATGPMVLATTTSTHDSGLLDAILPSFEESTGCEPKPVAVGSGQAMEMGARGDADVLLVHSPGAEAEFMAAGDGSSREPVMHNDFVLVGPPRDPARVGEADDAAQAMARIARARTPFVSRADESGTHVKERGLWARAGIEPSGGWYVETGQGMGETLTIADQMEAYTLTDRGSFLASSSLGSRIAFEGSPDLRNPYHVIVVDADGATNTACAEAFADWIRSEPVQQAIAGFGVDELGQPLFTPDALD